MKFSYNWLQTYFDTPLPSPAVIEEKLTFHSSEVEEVVTVENDTVFDLKVLPDKSAWLLSHRGLARELSVILGVPMKHDLLRGEPPSLAPLPQVQVQLESDTCDYYGAAIIEGVTVGPSPEWLKVQLEAIGQRSINNIVDATNYVMFSLGQPLHAFDAETFAPGSDGVRVVTVRPAKAGDVLTTLSGEALLLMPEDTLITDGVSGTPLALAGVKGGQDSGVTETTKTILLESAHFARVPTRLSARRHKLPTDAAKRYENGLSRSVAPYGLAACAALIAEVAGGTLVGATAAGDASVDRPPVTVSVETIASLLGVSITAEAVAAIIARFGYETVIDGNQFTVTPPHERDDLLGYEDLVEEVGRIYGLNHVVAMPPVPAPLIELNPRHYYAEKIRTALIAIGFSEVYTSSFRAKDIAKVKNALASDKSYLRSRLMDNLLEVRTKNIPHRDLLGVTAIKVFEIGTVFGAATEAFHVGLAVQTGTEYKAKQDDPLLAEAVSAIEAALGLSISPVHTAPGYIEFSLEAILTTLPLPTAYDLVSPQAPVLYKPFSTFPSVSRDVAMWVPEGTTPESVQSIITEAAGPLLARLTHLDTFTKEGRTSLAYRLVFQSYEKTLDGSEVDALMTSVYDAVAKAGFEVR